MRTKNLIMNKLQRVKWYAVAWIRQYCQQQHPKQPATAQHGRQKMQTQTLPITTSTPNPISRMGFQSQLNTQWLDSSLHSWKVWQSSSVVQFLPKNEETTPPSPPTSRFALSKEVPVEIQENQFKRFLIFLEIPNNIVYTISMEKLTLRTIRQQ